MPDADLHDLLDTVWSRLARGVADRRHPARHPTLATIGPEGPEARTLVLRAANRAEGWVELHTDSASPKVAHIAADPRVALHVWVPRDRLQIRLGATAQVQPGDPGLFARLPPQAQANYGDAAGRFAVIRLTVRSVDALVLDEPHRRALFRAPDWRGDWIAP